MSEPLVDRPVPRWWAWLLAGALAWCVLYLFVFALAGDPLSAEARYDQDVLAELKREGGLLQPDAETLLRLTKDDASLSVGASIFAANCAQCHGRAGEGMTGPNLTDQTYIHVRKIDDIPDVVTKGRNNGLMPPWGARLSPNEIVQVSAYVASLRGKNVRGKVAEGQEIPAWEAR